MSRATAGSRVTGHFIPVLRMLDNPRDFSKKAFIMHKKLRIVVGDDYAEFAKHENVVTVSRLLHELENVDSCCASDDFVIGQGVPETRRESLRHALRSRGLQTDIHIDTPMAVPLTHKRSSEHVLVTTPVKTGPLQYEFSLTLNDKNDRLSDHVTGQHVGAMLLMEAARQAVVVALELEYSSKRGARLGFVLERFMSSFHSYAFPLPTTLRVSLVESGDPEKHVSVALTIAFLQAAEQISTMQLDVTLYDTALLDKVEARKARKSIESMKRLAVELPVAPAAALVPA